MILPLLPFLMVEPAIVPTDSAPLIMEFAQAGQNQLDGPMRFEICADRLIGTQIGFDDFERRPTLAMGFDDEAARELAELTTRHIGERVIVTLEGQVVTDPIIQEPITGGSIVITGVDTVAEIERIERAARGRCTPQS